MVRLQWWDSSWMLIIIIITYYYHATLLVLSRVSMCKQSNKYASTCSMVTQLQINDNEFSIQEKKAASLTLLST